MAQLEIKKMKQGMSYSCKEKTIILNVFKYFRQEHPDKCVTEIVRWTAKATGCSEKSVFQFRKEEASAEGFKTPSTTKIRKSININSRDIKYDHNVRQIIRNIIYDLKFKNIVPSLNTILKQVNNNSMIPNFSLMTLRRLLFDMGFRYEKNGNKSVLVEKPPSNDKKTLKPPKKKPTKLKLPFKSKAEDSINSSIQQHQPLTPAPPPTSVPVQLPSHTLPIEPTYHHHHHHHHHPAMIQHHQMHLPAGPPPPMAVMINHSLPPSLNHQMPPPPPPPPPMDMHLKREMPWMHHAPPPPPNMMKQH